MLRYEREQESDPVGTTMWRRMRSKAWLAPYRRVLTTVKASSRTDAENESAIKSYFDLLRSAMVGVTRPTDIYNCDESCMQWHKVEQRIMTLITSEEFAEKVNLGGGRVSISFVPIVSVEGTRAVAVIAPHSEKALLRRSFKAQTVMTPGASIPGGRGGPIEHERLLAALPPQPSPAAPRAAEAAVRPTSSHPDERYATSSSSSSSSAAAMATSWAAASGRAGPPVAAAASGATDGPSTDAATASLPALNQLFSERRGAVMDPAFIPSEEVLSSFVAGGVKHRYFSSANGYMTAVLWREHMSGWVGDEMKKDSDWLARKKLLLLDGHVSHKDPGTIRFLERHNVTCVFLPGESSHMLQVLDNCPFGVWRKEIAGLQLRVAGAIATSGGILVANVARCLFQETGKGEKRRKELLVQLSLSEAPAALLSSPGSTAAPATDSPASNVSGRSPRHGRTRGAFAAEVASSAARRLPFTDAAAAPELVPVAGTGTLEMTLDQLKHTKTKIHPSDSVATASLAWKAISPAAMQAGFIRTGTLSKGPSGEVQLKPSLEAMKQRLKACSRSHSAEDMVDRALNVLPTAMAAAEADKIRKEILRESHTLLIFGNKGICCEEAGANVGRRKRFPAETRTLTAFTGQDLLNTARKVAADEAAALDAKEKKQLLAVKRPSARKRLMPPSASA